MPLAAGPPLPWTRAASCLWPPERFSKKGVKEETADLRTSVFHKQKAEELKTMKIRANFVKDGKWWMAWTADVPGALTQGATLEEARENLIDAVHLMQEPVDLAQLPKLKIPDP